MHDSSELTVRNRVFSLLCGTVYLAILIPLYAQLTGWPLAVSAVAVVLATAVIIAVIAIFCVKWVTQKSDSRQVKLSTLFLPFIPISIYLALFSQLLQAIRNDATDGLPVGAWIISLPFVVFVVLTTIVLMRFGEALVWLLLRSYRLWMNQRRTKQTRIECESEIDSR